MTPSAYYQQQIEACNLRMKKIIQSQQWMPYLRVVFFIGAVYFFYKVITGLGFTDGILLCISIAGFLGFSVYALNLSRRRKYIENTISINENELAAIKGDFSAFGTGKEFINYDHPYTHDLDVFGEESLFNCVNRTATSIGKARLADYMINAFEYSKSILDRQAAIRELSEMTQFRQALQLIFMGEKTSVEDLESLNAWMRSAQQFKYSSWVKFALYLFPSITIASIVLAVIGLLSFQFPLAMVVLQLTTVAIFGRRIMKTYHGLTENFKIIQRYAKALALIEKNTYQTNYLQALHASLNNDSGDRPSQIIAKLASLLNWMDSNLNMLVAALLNGLLMHNLHMLMAVEQWKAKYAKLIPEWFDTLAEVEALSSLATFTFNRPTYIFPKLATDEFEFVAMQMGHPLLPSGECVTNDVDVHGWKQYAIVTGANMSGKSTFLRSIGVNLILGLMGAPVYAASMTFFPIRIHTSIRTNDSLAKRESYFFAELKRLKKIIDELEQGIPQFILLDEILKGTNSVDKQTGSIALIKQLIQYHSAGVFATHDLALGSLIAHYPSNIQNLCFEISIKGNQMEIDYKLQKGICKNLNATFLMKNMGILIDTAPDPN